MNLEELRDRYITYQAVFKHGGTLEQALKHSNLTMDQARKALSVFGEGDRTQQVTIPENSVMPVRGRSADVIRGEQQGAQSLRDAASSMMATPEDYEESQRGLPGSPEYNAAVDASLKERATYEKGEADWAEGQKKAYDEKAFGEAFDRQSVETEEEARQRRTDEYMANVPAVRELSPEESEEKRTLAELNSGFLARNQASEIASNQRSAAIQAQAEADEEKIARIEGLYGSRLADLRRMGGELDDMSEMQMKSALNEQAVLARETEEKTSVNRIHRENERVRIETQNASRKLREESKVKSQQDIDAAIAEVVNFKIDPKRFYKNTGTAIASAIAVALGEFGSKLAGGPNTALAIISKAVDRDIDAQKTELSNLQYGASAAGNAYKRLLDLHGDAEKAELLAKEQALYFVKMELEGISERHKVPLQASRIGKLVAGIEKARISNAMAVSDKDFASRIEMAKVRPASGAQKLANKENEFFRDMSEFASGIQELKGLYREYQKNHSEAHRLFAATDFIQEKSLRAPTSWTPMFMQRTNTLDERSITLSKSLSKLKEGGKISDMDLVFYIKRMPRAKDANYMFEFKVGVLEALAKEALKTQTQLSSGQFYQFNKDLQKRMDMGSVSMMSDEEALEIANKAGIKLNLNAHLYGKSE